MRLLALLLIVTLTGPSVGALVCDWTCAATHQATAAAESNCHDAPGATQTATFSAAHACHELPTPAASRVAGATQVVDAPATVETATHESAPVHPSLVTRVPGGSHAPPPTHIVPLRV